MGRSARAMRAVGMAAAVAALCAGLAGCRPEPVPGPSASAPTPSATAPTPAPSATSTVAPSPTASATVPPDAGFQLPARCEDIYSPSMLSSLNAANPPLNDPGVTMHATQNVDALEMLSSGIPTIRCSWGKPSEFGLATNVSVIDAAQSAALLNAFRSAGFECANVWDGVQCTIEQRTIDQDDKETTLGESQFLRGTGWVSTAWVNFAPVGYTEDIVKTLWG